VSNGTTTSAAKILILAFMAFLLFHFLQRTA
jgi:hypothetical protein